MFDPMTSGGFAPEPASAPKVGSLHQNHGREKGRPLSAALLLIPGKAGSDRHSIGDDT